MTPAKTCRPPTSRRAISNTGTKKTESSGRENAPGPQALIRTEGPRKRVVVCAVECVVAIESSVVESRKEKSHTWKSGSRPCRKCRRLNYLTSSGVYRPPGRVPTLKLVPNAEEQCLAYHSVWPGWLFLCVTGCRTWLWPCCR